MQTPHHASVDSFLADEALFLATACLVFGENMNCAQCGTRVKWEVVGVSTHFAAEECIGTGKISQVDIPYCPQCEERPNVLGCFHVYEGQDVVAQLASCYGGGRTGNCDRSFLHIAGVRESRVNDQSIAQTNRAP